MSHDSRAAASWSIIGDDPFNPESSPDQRTHGLRSGHTQPLVCVPVAEALDQLEQLLIQTHIQLLCSAVHQSDTSGRLHHLSIIVGRILAKAVVLLQDLHEFGADDVVGDVDIWLQHPLESADKFQHVTGRAQIGP